MTTLSDQRSLCLFVGPTGRGVAFPAAGITVAPPARRGDIAQLAAKEPPGVIAVVDGTFHSYPSIGHAEIALALDRGWEVWGLSSMGAIRAAEMAHLGMRGFGSVYRRYADDIDAFDDDEVTLVHEAGPPYLPMSEPLIHIRECLDDLVRRRLLEPEDASRIADDLKRSWYGARTLPRLRDCLVACGLAEDVVRQELRSFDRHRVKKRDLESFLRQRPWLPAQGSVE